MEFKVLKSGGVVKKFRPIIFTIGEDEFYYQKKKNDDKLQRYHISYLNEVYIQQQIKEKPEYILMLDINIKNLDKKKKEKKQKIIKLAMKDDKNTNILSEIKKVLNVKRLQYDMNLFLFNWKQKNNISVNKDKFNELNELKDTKKIYNINHSIVENIEQKTNKEKLNELFQDKLNNFIKLLNQDNLEINLLDEDTLIKIKQLIEGSFILENEDNKENKINIENKENNIKIFDEINNFNNAYLNLIKLFTQIRFSYILKRFKKYDKKYLLEAQKYNANKNINIENENQEKNQINNSKILNESIEEIKILHSDTTIEEKENENQIKGDDIDIKMKKKKEHNERIQSRILAGLNSISKMKDNLKNMILSQNTKLYFCIRCNSLIDKTLLDKSNCNFDQSCTNRSFFYCKKCKLHLCTSCVVYQRGLKCSKNHKYFQKPVNTTEDIKCFICNKANIFPYYECKHCKEQICSDCAANATTRQNSCFNCNNELIWRKCIYTSCNRCNKLSDCFYYCICCDYSICINCSSLPKNMCGALHKLKQIDLMENYCFTDQINQETINKIYCYNYEVLFNGKCSWCNSTMGKMKIWACLRCSLFLCDKCVKRNND